MRANRDSKQVGFFGLVSLIVATLFIQSCGGNVPQSPVTPYHYQYTDYVDSRPVCTTGYKTAQTRDEYCALMTDDSKNKDPQTGVVCGHTSRQTDFAVNCPGYTWTAN